MTIAQFIWYNAHMAGQITKKFLEREYATNGLSTWAIEKKFGYSRSSIYNALKKFEISPRSIAQSHVKYSRIDFSGNLDEKAYLLGFTIGDLRVRNHNKIKSETISIACGSTKKAQIDLIEDLFKSYGRVWRGKPTSKGIINIEAFVNHSFNFLLKDEREYTWCANKDSNFYAFLAGFTDAEGSFYISDGKAFLAWGNYNKEILEFIHSTLLIKGFIPPNISCDVLKGTYGSHGYIRNQNYCHLSICRKLELEKIIIKLKPYLRHSDKLKRLALIEKNIKLRKKK